MTETELKELIRKAENNNIAANVNLGNYYNKLPDVKENRVKAFGYYKAAADLGYAPAQYTVGCFAYEGDGTRKDSSNAAYYWKLAADQNYANAQYALARMYQNGECGLIAKEQKAFKLFKGAAEQGLAIAQVALGDIYMFERKEIDNAVFWWGCAYVHGKSALRASNEAMDRLNDLVESGVPGGYDRVNRIVDEVQKEKYNTYTNNPK